MPLFSIIIPVYNVEAYLRRCIDSVLSQTFADYEIILVDDGSPDRSGEICDEYARRDSKIRVIHKSNGGSSDARNTGTEYARGEYIIYLDSDDEWIDNHGLESIADIVADSKPDAVIFGNVDYDPTSKKSIVSRGGYDESVLNSLPVPALAEILIHSGNFPGAAWLFAVNKKFLSDIRLDFLTGVSGEDYDWIIKVFSHAKSIKMLNRTIYQYRYNSDGSITSVPRLSGIMGIHNAIDQWMHSSQREDNPALTEYLAYVYMQALFSFSRLEKEEEKRKAEPILHTDSNILKLSRKTRYHLLYRFISVFGLSATSYIIRLVHSLSRR